MTAPARETAAEPAGEGAAKRWARAWPLIAGALAGALALALAWDEVGRPHREALRPLPEVFRALGGATVLFTVCGFGLVRLLLPASLREREVVWILPVGACASGLALTGLGFLAVPFDFSLPVVLAAGIVLGVLAVRRHGLPRRPPLELALPAWLAVLVVALALTPTMALGEAVPTGTGSDATLAAGTGRFLEQAYPTGLKVSEPVDRMPVRWGSKFPIYYSLAGASRLSGLETYQVLASMAALLLGLAALGIYLVARDLLAAGPAAASAALVVTALDPVVLRVGLNPYFNQTWGYLALPFALVLGWTVARSPSGGRPGRAAGAVLLGIFLAVLVLAYPLAAPIPAVALLFFLWGERARLPDLRTVLRDRRRAGLLALGALGVAAALAIPAAGALEKMSAAARLLVDPNQSLMSWGGDLGHFYPLSWFFALPREISTPPAILAVAVLAGLCALGLARRPRSLAWGLGIALALCALAAAYFRRREFGWYFEFKLLAFSAPLLLACAVAGAARLRRAGPVLVGALLVSAVVAGRQEIRATGYQLDHTAVELRGWARSLPPGASVRLDMWPPRQLWAGYFLHERRVCSRLPLLNTEYPRVKVSRKADYIVSETGAPRPRDATGPALRTNLAYVLYRMSPAVPGPDRCSQRMVQVTDPQPAYPRRS